MTGQGAQGDEREALASEIDQLMGWKYLRKYAGMTSDWMDRLRDAIVLAAREQSEPQWEYAQSEVLQDGTTAFGAPVDSLEEAVRRRDVDRINYPWPDELGVAKRLKAGPWLPVEVSELTHTVSSDG